MSSVDDFNYGHKPTTDASTAYIAPSGLVGISHKLVAIPEGKNGTSSIFSKADLASIGPKSKEVTFKLNHEKQSGDRWLKLTLHHLWTQLWQLWLI